MINSRNKGKACDYLNWEERGPVVKTEHLEPSHKDREHLGPGKKIILKLMYGSPCG